MGTPTHSLSPPRTRNRHGASRAMIRTMKSTSRTYRFVITVEVDSDHPAYSDPEWAADAAHGTLANEYGLSTIYSDITEVDTEGGEFATRV